MVLLLTNGGTVLTFLEMTRWWSLDVSPFGYNNKMKRACTLVITTNSAADQFSIILQTKSGDVRLFSCYSAGCAK